MQPSITYFGFTIQQWLSFGIVSVFFNLVLTSVLHAYRDRRRALAQLSAIAFECEFSRKICNSYKQDSRNGTRAWAPAYRLSTAALIEGIPWLRDHGFLFASEVHELMRLCLRMEEVNHCLDLVEEAIKQRGGDEDAAFAFNSRQSARCSSKCDHVLGPLPQNEDGTVPGAIEVIKRARKRIRFWLRPITFHLEPKNKLLR